MLLNLKASTKLFWGGSMNINIDLKQADNGTGSVRRNRFGEVQGEKQLSIKKKDRYKQSFPTFKK